MVSRAMVVLRVGRSLMVGACQTFNSASSAADGYRISVTMKFSSVTARGLRLATVLNSMETTPQTGGELLCRVRDEAKRAESFLKSAQESICGWYRTSLAAPSV